MKKTLEIFFRYLPAFGSLRNYSPKDFTSDLIAGLTVASVAVPQAMAYALIAGIDPRYGLYTAIVMTFVAAFFDSSRQLINGPTNAISIAVLSALAFYPEGEHLAVVMALALLVGLIQIVITLFRLGDLTRYVSHDVIIGFTLGAGVLLVLGQVKNLFGLELLDPEQHASPHDHFLWRFWLTISESSINWWATGIGIGTILFVVVLRRSKKLLPRHLRYMIPEYLLAVIIGGFLVWLFALEEEISIVGEIPAQLPAFSVPNVGWSRFRELAASGLAIAILGLLEAIAMAKNIANRTRQKLDINQQCLSEGIANTVGGFFQCMPGSGSLTRSAINHQAGAVSQWAAIISAVGVALTVLLFGRFAFYIPLAALAGILMVTAYGMIDRGQLLYHLRTTRFDAGIVLVTAFSAVFISVEFCILIGVFLSFVLYVPRAAKLELTELHVTPERVIREKKPGDSDCNRILIYNLEGELFFGSAPDLEKHLQRIFDRAADGIKVVVLRCRRARNPDAVGLAVVRDFLQKMQELQVRVLICGIRPDLKKALRTSGVDQLLGEKSIFEEKTETMSSTLDAVRHAYDILSGDYCSECPKRKQTGGGDESWYYMI